MIWDFLGFYNHFVYSNPPIRAPTGPKHPEVMKIDVFGIPIRQIWIGPVPREAEEYHLHFGNAFQYIFHKNKQKLPNNGWGRAGIIYMIRGPEFGSLRLQKQTVGVRRVAKTKFSQMSAFCCF